LCQAAPGTASPNSPCLAMHGGLSWARPACSHALALLSAEGAVAWRRGERQLHMACPAPGRPRPAQSRNIECPCCFLGNHARWQGLIGSEDGLPGWSFLGTARMWRAKWAVPGRPWYAPISPACRYTEALSWTRPASFQLLRSSALVGMPRERQWPHSTGVLKIAAAGPPWEAVRHVVQQHTKANTWAAPAWRATGLSLLWSAGRVKGQEGACGAEPAGATVPGIRSAVMQARGGEGQLSRQLLARPHLLCLACAEARSWAGPVSSHAPPLFSASMASAHHFAHFSLLPC